MPVFLFILTLISGCSNSIADDNSTQTPPSEQNENSDAEALEQFDFLTGFWHSAPDFSGGFAVTYDFFDGGYVVYRDYQNDNEENPSRFKQYTWYINEDGSLALDKNESEAKSYLIKIDDIDSMTGNLVIEIDGQKFWKMQRPAEVVNGTPLYIDYVYEEKDYLNKTVHKPLTLQGNETIAIAYDGVLYDFKICYVSFDYSDQEFTWYLEEETFHLDKFTFEDIVIYTTTLPEGVPYEAICFTDGDGMAHAYALGYDLLRDGAYATKIQLVQTRHS